jgi:protein SCO1/2
VTAALIAWFAVATTAAASAQPGTQWWLPPKALKAFHLVDQDGKQFGLTQLASRPAIVFFGFTNCPDVCPAALQKLRQLQRSYAADLGATRIVFVSVDGARDTPAVVKAYLARLSPTFIGLTGGERAVRDLASQFTAAFFTGTPIEHSGQIYLVDASGRIRAIFDDAPVATMAAVTREVASAP